MIAQTSLRTDWVSHIFFESPGWAIVVLAIIWMATRIAGRRTGNKRVAHLSWLPLLLVVALIASSRLVTTKRELLVQTLRTMILSVEQQDFPAFRVVVDERAEAFFPPEPNAQRFTRDMIEAKLKKASVRDIMLQDWSAAMIDDKDAVTVIRVRAQGDYDGYGGVQLFKWAIEWSYDGSAWKAKRFECLEIGIESLFNNKDKQNPSGS